MLDILITLTVVTILPCIYTSIHHVVPLKYMHFYLKSKIADSQRVGRDCEKCDDFKQNKESCYWETGKVLCMINQMGTHSSKT